VEKWKVVAQGAHDANMLMAEVFDSVSGVRLWRRRRPCSMTSVGLHLVSVVKDGSNCQPPAEAAVPFRPLH
jgi:hypothetical protein